eukprot:403335375
MESTITETFMIILSSFHNLLTSHKDLSRFNDPNTTSYLYNYSRDLNQSIDPSDDWYKNFYYHGYPSDTYAVHFVKTKTFFAFYLQTIGIAMVVMFILMGLVLLYFFVFQNYKQKQSVEYQDTLAKIREKSQQMEALRKAEEEYMLNQSKNKGSKNKQD